MDDTEGKQLVWYICKEWMEIKSRNEWSGMDISGKMKERKINNMRDVCRKATSERNLAEQQWNER